MTPEVPEKVQCMGCGRRIDVGGLAWKAWFRCAACGRVHILRERLARFAFDEAHRRAERRKGWIFVFVAFVLSTLGGWFIADRIGRPWLVYGIEWTTAAAICATVLWMNRRTQDILLVAGVVSALLTLRRIGLRELVMGFGAPAYTDFPWVMVATTLGCFAIVAYQRIFIESI